jgi:hypothetical protein
VSPQKYKPGAALTSKNEHVDHLQKKQSPPP